MSQKDALVSTMKIMLKARNLTYKDIASFLGLSEASVKRMFSEHSFSLDRIDNICTLMDIQISDLVKAMDASVQQTHQLTEVQESELVADSKLLLVSFLVINGWRFNEIVEHYVFQELELIQYLAKLDKLKIIELLPANRIKLLVSSKFSWLENGPIQTFFKNQLQIDFLSGKFEQHEDKHEFLIGMLTKNSAETLAHKIDDIVNTFRELNLQDSHISIDNKQVYSTLLASRAWRPQVFDKLRKS